MIWTLELIEDLGQVPETYLKHLKGTEGLCEIRVSFGTNIYRTFCFFTEKQLVILINSLSKEISKRHPNLKS
ncbi:MAG: type II toxin-antitoxin system RelE/ParE family toxin [Saprospiraceae bacterium]|nr:type II toxin-antitoxin system RelE/ParE family toxin [Saprospiraceae bacterium]